MSRCIASLRRKTHRNPLAGHARCMREAEEGTETCSIHSPAAITKRDKAITERMNERINADYERQTLHLRREEGKEALVLAVYKLKIQCGLRPMRILEVPEMAIKSDILLEILEAYERATEK